LAVMSVLCGCEKIEAPTCAMREREREHVHETRERGGRESMRGRRGEHE